MLYIAAAVSVGLLGVLIWSLRSTAAGDRRNPGALDEPRCSNLEYFPQISQALAIEDRNYLLAAGDSKLARAVARERRRVALDFLKALEEEFDHLMRVAGVIAALSPEVEAMQEFERLRLTAVFHVRLLVIRTSLALGARPLPELSAVSHVISGLTVRVEAGMKELGERAALAA